MLLFNTINDVQLHFATPVLCRMWPDAERYNPQLKQLILEKRRVATGITLSNRGGWQSRDDLLAWSGESGGALAQWAQACVLHILNTYQPERLQAFLNHLDTQLQTRIVAWANINGKGDWNSTHNHPNCHWSGVHYVQVPQNSGQIAFFDPRPGINMLDTSNEFLDLFRQIPRTVEPKEGMTVIFPSWLQHQVTTHEADEERISIAFNLRFITGAAQ